jgi:hypothetical protein
MHFNVSKCEVMRITHSRDKSVPNYYLEDMSLKVVHSVKDLGVNVSSDLCWNKHVGITVNKANKVLGIIKRTVGTSNRQVFSTLYKSLVNPILEYAVPVWCPHLTKNIHDLEKVQRRASRLALNQRLGEMSYEERCKKLGWPDLSARRDYLSLIECYKIVFGITDNLNFGDLFEKSKSSRTRANHR